MIPEGKRDIDENLREEIKKSFYEKNNIDLIKILLKLDLFPIKDSYVAYLKKDKKSIKRNPGTVNRICDRLYEMGLDKIFEKCSEPVETNRKIGPLFRQWLRKGGLGITPVALDEFTNSRNNAILDETDAKMMNFARDYLDYSHNKGLDFVARFNGTYIIGEAKFLTDFGGHQNAQFNDAISTVKTDVNAETIAILDGVLYIKGNHKMYRSITGELQEYNIMSSLVLRKFLYQL